MSRTDALLTQINDAIDKTRRAIGSRLGSVTSSGFPSVATVSDTAPSLTVGSTASLSLTPTGALRVSTEQAGTVDFFAIPALTGATNPWSQNA